MTRTLHVFPLNRGWAVQKEGTEAATYKTQREAIVAARHMIRVNHPGQLVIYGTDGRILDHETYGMRRVQDPPKKSRMAKRIGQAVGKVTLDRVQHPRRERSTSK